MPSPLKVARRFLRPLRRVSTGALRTGKLRTARRILCAPGDLSPDQLDAFALESPLDDTEKNLVRSVSLKVSPSDFMYVDGWSSSYLTAGLSAGRVIRASLDAAGKVVSRGAVLDFPCGYGRVLRFLKEMFPDSQVVGVEILEDALNFCRRTFLVEAYTSRPARTFRSFSLPHTFDLIWCGSLVTHIDEPATLDLLDFFCRHLNSGGVCVFTTLGRNVAHEMSTGKTKHPLMTEEGIKKLLDEYERTGYGYADYAHTDALSSGTSGISLVSRSHVEEMARSVGPWELVYSRESGWHKLNDVYAFMLNGPNVQHQ